ncbi:MAG: N-6 DNA methylase [Elusimicrobiota bacterium]|jgi:tRNA1(Val) A37 N6-methylase TrmN6|nr:N-6 DNA methylase [Elusimicrobiota bacterium]
MGKLIDSQNSFTLNNSVSAATMRNWERLNTKNKKERCSARANKRMSDKCIIPKESFDATANIPKVEKLVNDIQIAGYSIDDVIFSLGINLLSKTQISDSNLSYLKTEYDLKIIDKLQRIELPKESDLLGLIYQCLQTEGEKNIKGSYYTPKKVVQSMVADIKLKLTDKILDPCCGSLVFILNIPNIKPEQIFGSDIDPIAVMISKINYFIKFPQTGKKPKIYEADFLELPNLLNVRSDNFQQDINENNFDYIITNPPWGGISTANHFASSDILSDEIFSLFLVKSFKHLKNNGKMRFLLPCSILNVKTHQDIRKYLLEKTDLKEIKLHHGSFSGVMTQYISIETNKNDRNAKTFTISKNSKKCEIDKKSLNAENYFVISVIDNTDKEIIDKVLAKKKYDLSNAVWALGIVTGNNKGKLFDKPKANFEPIYTGKEIAPFKLKKAKKYIRYDRNNFQQVAKDEIYRADKKLVYKFISKNLVFSIDNSGQLFLNSANILIPQIPNMSINSVAAFLNSELYQYLYQKMFGEIKILKSSLAALPFINITPEQDNEISKKVENILQSKQDDYSDLQRYIYNLFEIDDQQINHIKSELYGNTN